MIVMNFRTEIEPVRGSFEISHDDRVVMLGSCFADNVGERMLADGFKVVHNPLGPLFNPASIARALRRGPRPYTSGDMVCHDGIWHCLDYAWRYHDEDAARLAERVNRDYLPLADAISEAEVLVITLGTIRTYQYDGVVVGNCHKLPAACFERSDMSLDGVVDTIIEALPDGKNVILTVSPVRYTADGLVANSLSKATLRLAAERIARKKGADYFPAYEIVNDDLRDYRFYAADMKHPSDTAVEYIYQLFSRAYFSETTLRHAAERRRQYMRSLHRPIIS